MVGQRPGNRALDVRLTKTAPRRGDVSLEVLGWFRGNELDSPPGRIAAEQFTLGATQYLYPVKIEQRKTREIERAGVGVVLIDGDGRLLLITIVVLRDSANIDDDIGFTEA